MESQGANVAQEAVNMEEEAMDVHMDPLEEDLDSTSESGSESQLAEIAPDEIDDMLEEGIKDNEKSNETDTAKINLRKQRASLLGPSNIEERRKICMKKRGQDYFDILPEGWCEITHLSGMPVYLHKPTRVCTMAKPYYLGQGSARRHEIPITAIPCYQYRLELEKEKQAREESTPPPKINQIQNQSDGNQAVQQAPNHDLSDASSMPPPSEPSTSSINNPLPAPSSDPSSSSVSNNLPAAPSAPSPSFFNNSVATHSSAPHCPVKRGQFNRRRGVARVESVKRHRRERCMNHIKVREYCQKLFEFQEITFKKFKSWAVRRKYNNLRRTIKQRPSLPESTKLIACPLPKVRDTHENNDTSPKEFVMNPAGKSYVCILHEFVQHTERAQPVYVYRELENANTPYSATVVIGDMEYGVGFGSSKRIAKSEAAKATLEIMIPDFKNMEENGKRRFKTGDNDLSFFDEIRIEDPRITDLVTKAGQSTPHQILVECLRRNSGMGDVETTTEVRLLKHQRIEYTMKVGNKHKASVICKNKRDGKQRAAQAILQKLHPQLKNWGSLLRLYGHGSCMTPKEKKEEEQKITELQATACPNRPNVAILNKLREEMLKLREKQPVQNFIPDVQPLGNGGGQLKLVDL